MLLIRFAPLSLLMASASLAAAGDFAVGYGAANSVLPAKNQELFNLGFELAIKSKFGEKRFKELVTSEFITDGSPAGALTSLYRLLERRPAMLVGFTTSHEAMQVAPVTSKKKILTIFAAAGHSGLAEFGPYIFTTGESMFSVVDQTIEFLRRNFPGKKGVFIYNPRAVFTVNQKAAFERRFASGTETKLALDFVAIDKDGMLPAKTLELARARELEYVYISMYPDESRRLMEQFTQNNIDLPTITNSSWTTMDLEFVRRELSRKKRPIVTNLVWEVGSKDSLPFEKMVRSYYGMKPTTEVAQGYDLGLITAQLIKRVGGPITREALYAAFHKDTCFDGLTVGRLCFDHEGGHSDRKIKFVRISKDGLVALSSDLLNTHQK